MKEDSDVFFRWLLNYDYIIRLLINELVAWSKRYFFKVDGEEVDYYSRLFELFRKILFYILFDLGFLGFFGVIIRDGMLCVVVMMLGGILSCYYLGFFLDYLVEDCKKVEYGYVMSNIYERMRDFGNRDILNFVEKIFKIWIC